MKTPFPALSLLACLLTSSMPRPTPAAEPPATAEFGFRFLGPVDGNRVASIAGVPSDPSVYYAGAASGGIWKSVDGGNKWQPIFDEQSAAAIGALAVATSNPQIVWAGTGEAWAIRDIDVGGDGIYKSTDAGKTWTNMGLPGAGRIGRIVIHPTDPDIVYVCTLGRMTGPQTDRGVYRTHDGGKTWSRSLFVDAKTGCSGLAMDPKDPRKLFAGMWQVEMHTWAELSGGPGSGLFVSHDGGDSWQRLTEHGLPHSPLGKIDVAIAPTNSSRVYALIQTDSQGSVWRSDDGGNNWTAGSWERTLIGRAGYYILIAVAADNPDKVLVASSSFWESEDGGRVFKKAKWGGGDNHDIWIDPADGKRFAYTHDGGLGITTVGDGGFHHIKLPIGQMYHVAVDDQIPYEVYGNMQDDGTMRGPSVPQDSPAPGKGSDAGWDHGMGGCESGFTFPDPGNPDIVWSTCYGDEVTRWDAKTKLARSVSPWLHTLDSAPNEAKYRCHWTPPLTVDPFEPNTLYFGCQVVFKTTNGGQSWRVSSPDLSRHDPSMIISSGGIVADNLGQFYGEVVFALATSKIKRGLLWAGTNDGKVWYTLDGGDHWTDVTQAIRGVPPLGTVTSIEPSHFDPAVAYVTFDLHLIDNRDPYIVKTEDYGKSWKVISQALPHGELAYVRNISEDPNARGVLFAGTGNALYYSLNDGQAWTPLKSGLPPSPVTWTVVQPRFHDLVISTWGRGFYVLDDITPLEAMAQQGTLTESHLFDVRPTYRLRRHPEALINFYLPSVPTQPVQLAIVDSSGQTIRTIENKAHAGLNRIAWDLHYDPLHTVHLLTIPPANPHIWEDSRFAGKSERPVIHWGMPVFQPGPLAAPGQFEVRLTVDGRTQSKPLQIMADPHNPASVSDLEATLKLQLRIRDDVNRVSAMVNTAEFMRKQLEDMQKAAASGSHPRGYAALLTDADKAIQAVEYQLFSKYLAPSDDKFYEHAYKVYYNLLWLNAEVGPPIGGDVAGGAEQGPTDTAPMLLDDIEQRLAQGEKDYHALMDTRIPAINQKLRHMGAQPLQTDVGPPKLEQPSDYDDDDPDSEDAD